MTSAGNLCSPRVKLRLTHATHEFLPQMRMLLATVRRRLLNLLTGLSLLLCVAMAALWVRSYSVFDRLTHYDSHRPGGHYEDKSLYIALGRGSLYVERSFRRSERRPPPGFTSTYWSRLTINHEGGHSDYEGRRWDSALAGFRLQRGSFTPDQARSVDMYYAFTLVGIPLWSVVLLTPVLPSVRLTRHVWHRRRSQGYCPRCGYDLRATPDRCPECGTGAT